MVSCPNMVGTAKSGIIVWLSGIYVGIGKYSTGVNKLDQSLHYSEGATMAYKDAI